MSSCGTYWAGRIRGVCPAKKAILFVLGECHNEERDDCFPSQNYIAEQACMSTRSVRTHLSEMEDVFFEKSVTWRGQKKVTNYMLWFDVLNADAHEEGTSEDKAEDIAALSDPDKAATGCHIKAANLTDKAETQRRQSGNCLPHRKGKEKESRKGAQARAGRARGPALPSRRGRGEGGAPHQPLDDVSIPIGLEGLADALATRIGASKAKTFLADARLIASNPDGETIVEVPSIWSNRVEDAGREFLKTHSWKVRAA